MSEVSDVRRWISNFPKGAVLDVGANVGQTALALIDDGVSPERIWCFEPVRETYDRLCVAVPESVNTRHLALGEKTGDAWVTTLAGSQSVNNHLLSSDRHDAEPTRVLRGDEFCRREGIDRIGYLKIDTEGGDLRVIEGFSGVMDRIDFVLLEVSMNPGNSKHVGLCEAVAKMESLGFCIFKVYEQVHEFDGRPILRRANIMFVSGECV